MTQPLIHLECMNKVFTTDEVVTHDARFARAADCTVHLFVGRIVPAPTTEA